MRQRIAIIFFVLMLAMLFCGAAARHSPKPIGRHVSNLLWALIPPMLGNFLIVSSADQLMATIGCYIYYVGMNITMLAVMSFTFEYCNLHAARQRLAKPVALLLAIDALQLLLNPLLGHAFDLSPILVDGANYYQLVPKVGQAIHRIIDYGLFFSSLIVFFHKAISVPRIYIERFLVILASMVFTGAWESYYIFSGTPVDRSMIGFGIFGLLVFYFSMSYRPYRLLDRMLARVVSEMHEAVFFFDLEGRCIYSNDVATQLVGIDAYDGNDEGRAVARLASLFGITFPLPEDEWTHDCQTQREGQSRFYRLVSHPVTDDTNNEIGSVLIVRDRTAAELNLRQERYAATHDALTNIYNKEHLYRVVRQELDAHPKTPYYLGVLNVRNFKVINDIYSTTFGDLVLRAIGEQLEANAKPGIIYGRMSSDRFGFLVPVDDFDRDALDAFLANFVVSDGTIEHSIPLHVGLYECHDPELEVSAMFDRASLALASIKNEYHTRIAFYDEDMRTQMLWDQKISAELDEALREHQIRPFLQPMVDSTGAVAGAEMLVRWFHPEEGFLPPVRFIPTFEANGRIAQVDRYMWRCACEILADWQRRGIDLFLSVNISPKDFYFMDVFAEIRSLIEEYGIDPARLRLEITETVMMTDLENRIRILEDLRKMGCLVEMDDFGSGYSSLNLLKDMPVDVLKIDMMFLYKTKDRQKAETILQSIINLSSSLGILSLTEGVETHDQVLMLRSMGCKFFQGYYFAKPMPLDEFERFSNAA